MFEYCQCLQVGWSFFGLFEGHAVAQRGPPVRTVGSVRAPVLPRTHAHTRAAVTAHPPALAAGVTGRYYARAVFDSRPEPLLTDDVDAVRLIVLSTAFRH